MAVITTKAEQNRAARCARAVGGYDELIRLGGQYDAIRRRGGNPRIMKDGDHWTVVDEGRK